VGSPAEQAAHDDGDELTLRQGVAALARAPEVWAWLVAAACCTLFDEIFVSLATLYLRAGGVTPAGQGAALSLAAVGAALGTLVTERALARWTSTQVILGACAVCVLSFSVWLAVPAGWAAPLTLLVGASTLPMWALAMARAYEAGPGPGLVAAGARVLGVIDVVAPVLLGLVAEAHGLPAALGCLLVQPLVVAAVALRRRRL
jgi:fucose permease